MGLLGAPVQSILLQNALPSSLTVLLAVVVLKPLLAVKYTLSAAEGTILGMLPGRATQTPVAQFTRKLPPPPIHKQGEQIYVNKAAVAGETRAQVGNTLASAHGFRIVCVKILPHIESVRYTELLAQIN